MTDQPKNQHGEPMIGREAAPEHGPNFWGDLEASLTNTTSVLDPVVGTAPPDRTEQIPAVVSMTERTKRADGAERRLWPLAAAAVVLAVLGFGFLAVNRTSDPSTTAEVVAGTTESDQVAPLDGPTDGSGDTTDDAEPGDTADDADSGDTSTDETQSQEQQGTTTDTADASATVTPVPTPTPARVFDSAYGAEGTALYPPFDDSLTEAATFLANWETGALTWYADLDKSTSCVDANVGEIAVVNGSGLVQPIRDPQLRFSGEVSHFTLHPEDSVAAWLVACGSQLELYTGTLTTTGHVEHLNLVWLGQGSPRAALILWDDDEVSLNAIDPGGDPFAITYDLETDTLTRNGNPSRDALEEGSPVWRSSTPLVATTDGGVSYWVGEAPADIFSACPEIYGSDETETLWLRYGDGTWLPSLIEETPLGRITAAAVEPTFTQIAFADICEGQTQRLFIGTQQADGRITNLRELSLVPYVPGPVSELFWVDAETLQIETDNSQFGTPDIFLEYRLDEDLQSGVIVQLPQ